MNKMEQIKKITESLAETFFENSDKLTDGLYKTLMDSLHKINKLTTLDDETEEYENSDPDEDEYVLIDGLEYVLRPEIIDELITNRILVINTSGIVSGYLINGTVEWIENKKLKPIKLNGDTYYINDEYVFDKDGILCGDIKDGIITIS